MTDGKNFYSVLHVSPESNDRELKVAYRKLALQFHPDKNLQNKIDAEEKFKVVCKAYYTLSNPEKRMMYDLFGDPEEAASEVYNTQDPDIDIFFKFDNVSDSYSNLYENTKRKRRKRSRSREKHNQDDFETAFYKGFEEGSKFFTKKNSKMQR